MPFPMQTASSVPQRGRFAHTRRTVEEMPPRSATCFTPGLGNQQILDGVAALITAAGGLALSVRQFNQLRAGHVPPLPSAQAIVKRLGVSWPEVRALASLDAPARAERLGHLGAEGRPEFPEDGILIRALRSAALRAGGPLSPDTYNRVRPALQADLERASCLVRLPHPSSFETRFGSWRAAMEWAGLEAPTAGPPAPRRARPATELLDAFIEEFGVIPPSSWFPAWCRAKDIPVGRDARRWTEVVARVRADRNARGLPTPDRLARIDELPLVPQAPESPRKPKGPNGAYTRRQVLDSLRRYRSEHLVAGRNPTWRDYRAAAATDPQLVPSSCLSAHGRFQDLCREAGL